jgi:hypothetical protein
MSGAAPLISVGIPTYNRASTLRRAIESVLAQSERDLELVISDNASSDGTEAVCREAAEADVRVRYLRAPANRGPTANFNLLFEQSRGEFAMVLSDDDWLESNYLAVCLAELRARPELVLACGRARYVRDGRELRRGADMQLLDVSPRRRVVGYLRDVDENGVFYGLMRTSTLRSAAPLRNALGNDWLLVAGIAAQGRVATLEGTAVCRELDGTSADFTRLARTLGLPQWQAYVPHLVISWQLCRDIAGRSSAYGAMRTSERIRLMSAGALAAIRWRSLAWHATMPLARALGARPGGGALWRAYERLTRALGAGGSE